MKYRYRLNRLDAEPLEVFPDPDAADLLNQTSILKYDGLLYIFDRLVGNVCIFSQSHREYPLSQTRCAPWED